MFEIQSFHHNCQFDIWKSIMSYLINACVTQPKTYTNPFDRAKWCQRFGATRCNCMEKRKKSLVPFHHLFVMALDASDDTDWAHRRPCDRLCKQYTIEVNSDICCSNAHSQDHFSHCRPHLKAIRVTNTRTKGKPQRDDCVRLTDFGPRFFVAIFQQHI